MIAAGARTALQTTKEGALMRPIIRKLAFPLSRSAAPQPHSWTSPRHFAAALLMALSLPVAVSAQAAVDTTSMQIGRLTSTGNGDTRIYYQYDGRGRNTATQYVQDGQSRIFRTEYGYPQNPAATAGAGTKIVKEIYPDGEEVTYEHDATGQVVAVRSIAGAAPEDVLRDLRLNARGLVTRIDLGNGTSTTYSYDDAGDLRMTRMQTVNAAGQTIQDYGYDHDGKGNVIETTDGVRPGESFRLQYDSLGQLTAMLTLQGSVLERYAYDSIGNLTQKGALVQNYNAGGRPHALADSDGIAYQYDANGNVTAIGSRVTLEWTADNLPKKVTAGPVVTEKWHIGEALWKKVVGGTTTYYLPAMRLEDGAARKYYGTYAERADPPAGDRQLRFYHGDHLGSSSVMTDKDGNVIRRVSYWPWGTDRGVDATFTPKLQFNFKEKEEGTGFYDYGARLYNPATGRWLSPDKYLVDGLNRYAYVRNNPWTRFDPTGNFSPKIHRYILSKIFPYMGKMMFDQMVRGSDNVDGFTWDQKYPKTLNEDEAHLHGMLSKKLLDRMGGDRQKAIAESKRLVENFRNDKKGEIATAIAEYKKAVSERNRAGATAALARAHIAFGEITHTITDPKSMEHREWQVYDERDMKTAMNNVGPVPTALGIKFGTEMIIHGTGEDDIDEIPLDIWTESMPEIRRLYIDLIANPAGINSGISRVRHPSMQARP